MVSVSGASPSAKGDRLPSVKLDSISSVTGLPPMLRTVTDTSAAGEFSNRRSVWTARRLRASSSVVTMFTPSPVRSTVCSR